MIVPNISDKMKKPIYGAFVSPCGGVGKTTLTILTASGLHYGSDDNVAIVDCNYPMYPINFLRKREAVVVGEEPKLGEKILRLFHRTTKRAYRVVDSTITTAIQTAQEVAQTDDKLKLILFDVPTLMSVEGVSELLSKMDFIVFPITGNSIVCELTSIYLEVLNEQIITMGKGDIKAIYLLSNMINHWEWDDCMMQKESLAESANITSIGSMLPFTKDVRFNIIDNTDTIGVSTLLPMDNRYGTPHTKRLIAEISKIVDELCGNG